MKNTDWWKLSEKQVKEVRKKQLASIKGMDSKQMEKTVQAQRRQNTGISATREDER